MIRRSYYTPVYYSGASAAVNPPYGQAPSGVYPPSVPSSPYPATYSYPSASYTAYPPATNPSYRTPVTYPAYPPVTNQSYPPVTTPAYPSATTPAYPMSYHHYTPTVSSSYQPYYGSYQSPYYGYSSQRTYTRGWTSGFDPFQDYNSSTISDTGRGSANRANQPGYPIPAVPSIPDPNTDIGDGTHPAEGQINGSTTGVKEIRASSVYEKIFNEHLKSNSLWEDPDFPASDRSLYYKNPPGIRSIEWKRPHEICSCPKFAKGASRNDIHQGKLGDCWVLAAVADLTTNEKLFQKVVPQEQSFDKGRYAGVFRFVFWQYGRWVEVLVDDRLPTHNGKLVYMTSEERNEYWSSLLEKAYAKLYGSYEALVGGLMSESLEDFTGGISRKIEIGAGKTPSNLGQILLKATSVGALMGCSIDCTNQYTRENQLRNGLIVGHAYSIVDVKKVKTSSQREVQLLRIRNPWGDEHEWNGPWSDESREWSSVSEDERKRMNIQSNDGEFWMSLEDFSREFQTLEICYLGPDSVCDIDHLYQKAWQGTLIEGSWKRKVNAGGCRNFPETFWTNPQYKIHIPAADADEHADGLGTIIVGLMQCNRRKLRKDGKDNFSIGYVIFRLKDPNCGTLGREFFSRNESVAKSPAYIDAREIGDVHRLPPGDYVIVPTTFEQNLEGDFIVRVFSERKDHRMKELDDDHTSSVISSSSDHISTDEVDPKESEFENEFEKVVGSKHGAMNARQLQSLLNARFAKEMGIKEFQMDLCRSLLALHDLDISGNLNFEEFKLLNKDFFLIRKCFNSCDKEHHGFIHGYEMRTLLHTIAAKSESLKGLRISNSTFNAIVMRYSDENGKVFFDDFLSCTSKLKTLFGTFQAKDIHSTGIGEFHVDEFIQLSIYS